MADSELGISVSGSESLGRVASALGDADATMADKISDEMVLLANRLATIAKRRALEEPAVHGGHTGLRAQVSAGVSVHRTPTGAVINTSMPQSDEAIIPRGLDDGAHGWRHPVFGNRNEWVTQHGAFSWFMDSMQGGRTDGEQNLERLLEETAERIAAAAD